MTTPIPDAVTPGATVAVTVKLGRPLAERLDDGPGEAGLVSRVAAGLRALATRLNVPVEPHVTVRRLSHDARPVRVQIGDEIHAYSEEATGRLWEALAGAAAATEPFAWARWTTDAPGLDLLAGIVVETVKQHPDRVLTSTHVETYASAQAPTIDLRDALAAVMRMGIALPPPAVVLELLSNGALNGPDLAEHLIAAGRQRTVQIRLRADDLEQLLDRDADGPVALADLALADNPFAALHESQLYDRGLRLPAIAFVPADDVPSGCVVVRLNDLDGPPVRFVAPTEVMVNAEAESLRALGVRARPAMNPSSGAAIAAIDRRDLDTVKRARPGIWTWTAPSHVGLVLAGELRCHAARLVDTESVEHELALLSQAFPDLVEAVLEVVSLGDVTRVFRGLVDEEVSLRDLRGILERLLTFDRVFADTLEHAVFDDRLVVDTTLALATFDEPAQRVEHVRAGLKPQLGRRYAGDSGGLSVWMLDRKTESRLLEHLAATRPLGAHELDHIREAIRSQLESAGTPPPALFTLSSLRRFVRELVRDEFPRVPVLAHADLPASVHVEVIGRIAP